MAYIGNPIVSTDFPVDYFSGNGSTTAFTLSIAPASVNAVDVLVSGVAQSPQTYTISGTTLTFSAAPPSGSSNIVVKHRGIAGIPNVPAVGSVTTASLAAQDLAINGVTVGKGGGNVASNTVVGVSAINGTGYSNSTAVGYQALYTGGGGTETAIGSQALYSSNSSAGFNTAVGYRSLYSNTTGLYNVSMGVQALQTNTTASNNTAVGYQAGYSQTIGTSNLYLGNAAGYSSVANNNNTFVGSAAGYYVSSGNKNTILGTYNGNQGGLDIRTASNYIVLSDGDGNPIVANNGAGITYVNTPSGYYNSWDNIYNAIQLSRSASLAMYGPTQDFRITSNAYYNSSNWKRVDAAYSSQLLLDGSAGRIYTYTAGTSTAGSNIAYTQGPYLANLGTSWTNSSDERLKDITGEIQNGLEKVCSLRAAEYTWKADETKKPQVGLIAQDVEKVLPEVVVASDKEFDGTAETAMGINYDQVVPLLVAAIKELKAEIQALKGTV